MASTQPGAKAEAEAGPGTAAGSEMMWTEKLDAIDAQNWPSLVDYSRPTSKTNADVEGNDSQESQAVVADMETIALKALHVDDDPSLNPWTFRMFFLGMGLSAFGSSLATIFIFRPQGVSVSVVFLTVISYFGGRGLEIILPKTGVLGRWLNPHPFNSKEHLAIVIMSGSASGAAFATEVLATQRLYYNVLPNVIVAILLLFSSQLLGYGMAGVLRKSLVYPTKMIWPSILPLSTLIETLHRNSQNGTMRKRFRFFWIIFGAVAVWELFPQYIMPILTGVSVFCLANRNSLFFTNLFGGAAGNEGLGLLSLSFDWQYVGTGPFFLPLITQLNSMVGAVGCMALFMGLYYGNVWRAMDFPFLSQSLFSRDSNTTHFVVFNQSAILDANLELDPSKIATEGVPFYSASNASFILTTNLGVTATLLHVLLWNRDAVRNAFVFTRPDWSKMRMYAANPGLLLQRKPAELTPEEKEKLDPHHRQMLVYDEAPSWWYIIVLVLSTVIGLICVYLLDSTLPWWGFIIAVALSYTFTLFFGAMNGLIGFQVPIQPLIQLIGGYLHPGKPVANMYFVLFGNNCQSQAIGLVANLKLGQYGKLSPRCTFTVSIIGTMLGALLNYILMNSIITNQRDILLSLEGTNIWSGQAIQAFNSNAIAFGALPRLMFAPGSTYEWVLYALPLGFVIPLPFYLLHRVFPNLGFSYIVTPVILWFLGFLSAGINSSLTVMMALGIFVQLWVRKRYPRWFLKYNYVLAAAISGGTELLVFVTTFAVQGASGKPVLFPPYWGNNFQSGNVDYCARNPALGG